jgi:hypothetical protein
VTGHGFLAGMILASRHGFERVKPSEFILVATRSSNGSKILVRETPQTMHACNSLPSKQEAILRKNRKLKKSDLTTEPTGCQYVIMD